MIDKKSKLLLITVLFAILSVSCEDKKYEQILSEQRKLQDSLDNTIEGKILKIPKNKFETVTFEGCQYLIYKEDPDNNSSYGFMAHKGNCSNPIHKTTSNRIK